MGDQKPRPGEDNPNPRPGEEPRPGEDRPEPR